MKEGKRRGFLLTLQRDSMKVKDQGPRWEDCPNRPVGKERRLGRRVLGPVYNLIGPLEIFLMTPDGNGKGDFFSD